MLSPHVAPLGKTLAGTSCFLWDCDGDLGLQLAMDLLLRGGSVTVFSSDNSFLDRARIEAEDIRADERFTAIRGESGARLEELVCGYRSDGHPIFLITGLGSIWDRADEGKTGGECLQEISSLSIGTARELDFTHAIFNRVNQPDNHTEAPQPTGPGQRKVQIISTVSWQAGPACRIRFPAFLERHSERFPLSFDIFLPLFDDSVCRDIVPRQMPEAVMHPPETRLHVRFLSEAGEHYYAQEIPDPGHCVLYPESGKGRKTLGRIEHVSVRDTILGKGIFAERDFTKGEAIIHEKGFPLNFQTGHTLQTSHKEHLDVGLPARNLNHSCEPNVGIRSDPVTAWPRIVAFRNIRRGEELTLDYGMAEYMHYERIDPGKGIRWEFTCACNTPTCRGRMGYYSELPQALRDKYRGFVSGYLEAD